MNIFQIVNLFILFLNGMVEGGGKERCVHLTIASLKFFQILFKSTGFYYCTILIVRSP